MRFAAGLALGAVLVLASFQAGAQARYQCRLANGASYLSDRPCPPMGNSGLSSSSSSSNSSSNTGRAPPVYYGPTEQPYRYQPPPPSVGEAPDYITYMSTKCSGLHDALRTAAARGLTQPTVSEMRKNYQRECAENESEARMRYSREHGEKRQVARTEQDAEKRAQERTKQQEQQCGESKRILVTKRARTDLNEGEKAELQRFEANYRARCG
jgi:hypothetical protein